jgi:hypothetical protein
MKNRTSVEINVMPLVAWVFGSIGFYFAFEALLRLAAR